MPDRLTHIEARTHRDDLYRTAQRNRRIERHVRQALTRAPKRTITRRPRAVPLRAH